MKWGQLQSLGFSGEAKIPLALPMESQALQSRLTIAFGCGQEYIFGRREAHNGNPGLGENYEFQA